MCVGFGVLQISSWKCLNYTVFMLLVLRVYVFSHALMRIHAAFVPVHDLLFKVRMYLSKSVLRMQKATAEASSTSVTRQQKTGP